ncbi:hypothetical protein GUJ93_ZPchr0014g46763 [Zizania palustris]|uniref:Retrovirus-related Pol polyprotein from transposon TNT 1-94-like beta-barrel domain-containing protein n=1 Tax=Zizania palustris TaxID=103762 RepID=A0A8J5W6Q7_ZIZPA|nr:hypothetical protein GUJ93_ZPchr0014g46763 [Zizania palustris]
MDKNSKILMFDGRDYAYWKLKSTEIAKVSCSGIGNSLPQSMALVSSSSSGTSSGGKRGKVAKRVARAFVAALSDIDNTSSEEPSSDEEEPCKSEEKKEKTKDFNDLCFMANDKHNNDELDSSEGRHGRLEDKWIIDSGCSCHVIEKSSWFSSFTSAKQRENIMFGNNRKSRVKGQGLRYSSTIDGKRSG